MSWWYLNICFWQWNDLVWVAQTVLVLQLRAANYNLLSKYYVYLPGNSPIKKNGFWNQNMPFVCFNVHQHDDVIKWKHFPRNWPLCGEITGPGEFPTQRPVTRSFDVFFDLRLNKRLSKQPWGWWFETLSWSLWRHCSEIGKSRHKFQFWFISYLEQSYSRYSVWWGALILHPCQIDIFNARKPSEIVTNYTFRLFLNNTRFQEEQLVGDSHSLI